MYFACVGKVSLTIRSIVRLQGRKDWKDVSAKLKKENPSWRLPDRRVAKFVKRQKAGNPIGDDESVVSTGSSIRSFFKRRSKGKVTVPPPKTKEEVQKEEEAKSQLPPLEKEPEEEPDLLEKVAPIPVEEQYKDANEGNKDSGLCAGCIIL